MDTAKRRFEGKVALVTGGNSGLGRAAAVAFAAEGAKVVIAARRQREGDETVEAVRQAGGEAVFVRTDVSQANQVEAMVARTIEAYGHLDYACNNAAIEGVEALTADYTEAEWDLVLDINLKGVWLCMKYQIPEVLRAGGGAIVNVASGNGLVGASKFPAYVASKHGVVGLTKAAALDYAQRGIRINALCTSSVLTPMHDRLFGSEPDVLAHVADLHPCGWLSTPEQTARAILWLCSDAASYMTGHPLVLDGGWLAR